MVLLYSRLAVDMNVTEDEEYAMTRGLATTGKTSLAALTASVMLLAACSGGGEETESGEGGDTEDGSSGLSVAADLSFATLDQGSAWYNYGVSIGQVLESELPDGSVVEVLPYSGSIGNPELVATGEAQIATTFSAVASWAHTGEADTPFEDGAFDSLRVLVGGVDQYYFGPIAPRSAPFESLQQVVDEQIGIDLVSQPRGSLGDAGTRLILNAYGTTVEEVESWGGSFDPTSTDVATNAIRDGRADLWIQAITAGHPNITELAETADIQILDISEDAIDNLSPLGLSAATLPGGTFTGQEEDANLVGFSTAIITSADLDDELAYAVTKSIVENAEELKEANASMASFEPELAFTEEMTGGVPLHPGAEQYFRDAGLMD